jgi:Co/Zn/Cd efflux system component
MSDCCAANACEVEKLRDGQRSTLLLVLWINLVLFVVEGVAGVLASSIALLADALDMLGDALIYGFSACMSSRAAHWRSPATRGAYGCCGATARKTSTCVPSGSARATTPTRVDA